MKNRTSHESMHIIIALALILFVSSTQLIIDVYGSPKFNRQEVKDMTNDWVINTNQNEFTTITATDGQNFSIKNAKNIEDCKTENNEFPFPDIAAVSYMSDGKTLNATLWLSDFSKDPSTDKDLFSVSSFKELPWHNMGYTMSIDVISAYDTGPDNYVTTKWNPFEQSWTKVVEEASGTGKKRVIYEEKPHFDYGRNYILFSLDLDKVGSPEQYNILITTYDVFVNNGQLCYLLDIGNWIQAPPPEFIITTSPNPVVLRPGEQVAVEVQVKSITNSKSNVHITAEDKEGVEVNFRSNDAFVPPLGIGTLVIDVKASDKASYHTYTIPVYANFTFPTVAKLRESDYMSNQVSTSTLDISNFIITVRPPLTSDEKFSGFWTTYGGVISLVWGGIAATVIKILFDKRQERQKLKERDAIGKK